MGWDKYCFNEISKTLKLTYKRCQIILSYIKAAKTKKLRRRKNKI